MLTSAEWPVREQPRSSRWRAATWWLATWVLAIPHYLVLALLWPVFLVLTVVAFLAILITGRYPAAVFEFTVGVLRWSWRVGCYVFGVVGTDRYPPFTLAEVPDFPAHLHVEYPQRLSRRRVLVTWSLLTLPLSLLFGGIGYAGSRFGALLAGPVGTLALLVLLTAVVLAGTCRYPQESHDVVLCVTFRVLRLVALAALMTDTVPPWWPGRAAGSPRDHAVRAQHHPASEPSQAFQLTPPGGRSRDLLPAWVMVLLGVGATAVLGAVVWAAGHLHPDNALRSAALFVHLAALVVGFGAVLAVDWFALLWLLGRRSLPELSSVTAAAHLPIWLGLVGLILTGALCGPNLSSPLTWVKLSLVLLVTLNGLQIYALAARLLQHHDGAVPRRLLGRAGVSATISQLCWWGAMVIGFVNAQ